MEATSTEAINNPRSNSPPSVGLANLVKHSTPSTAVRANKYHGNHNIILNLPPELILQMCDHLHPYDLVCLSETSKDLRSFFKSPHALLFWKVSLRNVADLPPCPDDMDERSYLTFVFSFGCYHCPSTRSYTLYNCRTRLCVTCRTEREVTIAQCAEFDQEAQDLISPDHVSDFVPTIVNRGDRDSYTYYKPQLLSFLAVLKKVPTAELEAFLTARKQFNQKVNMHEGKLRIWARQRPTLLKIARLNSILERLAENGWHEEVIFICNPSNKMILDDFRSLAVVDKPSWLTSKAWVEIEPCLRSFMCHTRSTLNRLRRKSILLERLIILRTIVQELKQSDCHGDLTLREITLLPGVADMIDPTVAEFDPDDLVNHLLEEIPSYVEKREGDVRGLLESALRQRFDLEASCDPFSLAIGTWFRCCRCGTMKTLQAITAHQCSRGLDIPDKPDGMANDYYVSALEASRDDKWIWSPAYLDLGFDKQATIIEMCGFDVKTATATDLDQTKVRLRSADYHDGRVAIMTWRGAMIRQPGCPAGDVKSWLTKANESEAAAARALETALWEKALESWRGGVRFRCAYCFRISLNHKEAIVSHVKARHGIEEPEDADLIEIEAPTVDTEWVFLIPKKMKDELSLILQSYIADGRAALHEFD